MQDELDQKETDYRLMNPEEFYSALDDIENADIRRRQMKDQVRTSEKAMRASKRAAADSSSDDNTRANKKRKKGRDNKSKSTRTTAQGTARYCELCKKANMPYGKYSSHSTSQCKDAAEMKAKLSGGRKDRAEATNSWKQKEHKAILKEVKVLKKQNKQLMKIMSKSKKSNKKEMKNLHKIVNRTRNFAFDSSDSDSSASSEK
jgi:hypothetical protein